MSLNVKTSRAPLWWIVAGIGLVVTGCADDPAGRRDDNPLPCIPEAQIYEIQHVDPSAYTAQIIDLDGDKHPDDSLGRAHDLITAFAPAFDVADRFDARLATDVKWRIVTEQCEHDVRVTVDAPEIYARQAPRAAGGITDDGVIEASDGVGQLPLIALADAANASSDPGWRTGDAMTVRATVHGDTLEGVFAFALPTDTVRADLAAPLAAFLTAQPVDQALRVVTDSDHDGIVTAAEIAATTTYKAMTQSDLTLVIDAQPQTSISFRFVAKRI